MSILCLVDEIKSKINVDLRRVEILIVNIGLRLLRILLLYLVEVCFVKR